MKRITIEPGNIVDCGDEFIYVYLGGSFWLSYDGEVLDEPHWYRHMIHLLQSNTYFLV
jgi:hypothetical protein